MFALTGIFAKTPQTLQHLIISSDAMDVPFLSSFAQLEKKKEVKGQQKDLWQQSGLLQGAVRRFHAHH